MGIAHEKDRTKKIRVVVSRRWPDGSCFRRYQPNKTVAKKVLARINEAIAMGTWRELKEELVRGIERVCTVKSFWLRFRDEYCKPRLTSWKRYDLSFRSLNETLGDIVMREFRRQDLHGYVQKRKGKVSDSTINKDIAAIKKMFSFALEVGAIDHHPLVKFPAIRVQETALRLPTLEEFRHLVDCMPDAAISALVAVLGETGMRKSEALALKRSQIDRKNCRIIIEKTKGKKVRTVPLSQFAMEKLGQLVVHLKQPYVFVHQHNGRRWMNPDKKFRVGRKAAGLPWVTFHTLRHLRGTSWLSHGVDLRSVKELLGHADISTTMRYVHYVDSHADQAVRKAQAEEAVELKGKSERATSGRRGKEA